jgi:hypothetical protein
MALIMESRESVNVNGISYHFTFDIHGIRMISDNSEYLNLSFVDLARMGEYLREAIHSPERKGYKLVWVPVFDKE